MDADAMCYQRFLDGDMSGLEELIRLYSDRLCAFINSIVRSPETAEDLMEDAFAELLSKRHRFRGDAAFRTYLFRIGRNKALNHLRQQGRIHAVSLDSAEPLTADILPLEEQLCRDERHRLILRAMGRLPADYQTILYLLYFEELSYEASARIMKKTPRQIKNLAYRARKALKGLLEQEGLSHEDL